MKREPTNYIISSNDIMFEITEKCTREAWVTYMFILYHRNNETNMCFPSLSCIANEMGTSTKTVSRHIIMLEKEGYLLVNSGKQRVSNNYYFPKEYFFDDEVDLTVNKRKSNLSK